MLMALHLLYFKILCISSIPKTFWFGFNMRGLDKITITNELGVRTGRNFAFKIFVNSNRKNKLLIDS